MNRHMATNRKHNKKKKVTRRTKGMAAAQRRANWNVIGNRGTPAFERTTDADSAVDPVPASVGKEPLRATDSSSALPDPPVQP